MGVASCPPGLRAAIFERDAFTCAACSLAFPEFCLQLQHLIVRGMGGAIPKHLRWNPKELITVCAKCHPRITDGEKGYEWLTVSKWGDMDANLDAFWMALCRDWKIEDRH